MTLAEMLAAADQAAQGIDIENSNNEYKPLPPGDYNVAVEDATGPLDSKRPNPTNPAEFGKYIKIRFTVTDGQYANRKLFMNNNIIVYPASMGADDARKAQTAMAMGNNERKILLASLRKTGISDASELVGATCRVKVAVKKNSKGVDDNQIVRVMAASDGAAPAVPAAPSTPVPSAAPAAPAARAKMPWEK